VVRLERIQSFQTDGHTLLEIGRILSGSSCGIRTLCGEVPMEPPTAWWKHAIGDDVIVWLKDGTSRGERSSRARPKNSRVA
jgi:hypothetical protein